MPELVDNEVVGVNSPGAVSKVVPEGRQICVIGFFPLLDLMRVDEPRDTVKGQIKSWNLNSRDEIALTRARTPIQDRLRILSVEI